MTPGMRVALIRRFSTEWQERRQEEKQRERAFMEQAASAESMGRWISVREALLAL